MYVAAQPRPWMAIEMTVSTALFQIFYWFALIFIEITWGGKRDCLRIYPLFLRLPDLILEIDHKFFSAFSVDICSICCPLQEIPLLRESLFGFRAHLHFGATVREERGMLEPAAKERLKKGGGAEEEEPQHGGRLHCYTAAARALTQQRLGAPPQPPVFCDLITQLYS